MVAGSCGRTWCEVRAWRPPNLAFRVIQQMGCNGMEWLHSSSPATHHGKLFPSPFLFSSPLLLPLLPSIPSPYCWYLSPLLKLGGWLHLSSEEEMELWKRMGR